HIHCFRPDLTLPPWCRLRSGVSDVLRYLNNFRFARRSSLIGGKRQGHLTSLVVRWRSRNSFNGYPVGYSLYGVGERSLFHILRNAPSVMGRAPAKRKTTSPTMRSHSSLWEGPPIRNVRRRAGQYPLAMEYPSWI